jgi:hypothetical protein
MGLESVRAARRSGAVDPAQHSHEVRRLGRIELSGAVLRRQAPGIPGAANETPRGSARYVVSPGFAIGIEQRERHHLVDNAGQLARNLAALHLRLERLAAELVDDALQDADENHGPAWRVLQVFEEGDGLAREKPIACRFWSDQDKLIFEIEDTGHGIPPENVGRIFDPFFTSRPTGTGLGLWIVLRLVQSMQGNIAINSVPGQGTLFRIQIPREPKLATLAV